jgi:hypothetical protein
MTVTLNLKPEVEAGLLAQARDSGMPLEQYLLYLIEGVARPAASNAAAVGQPTRADAVRRMAEFGEKHRLNLGEPMSRELLHEGHRF